MSEQAIGPFIPARSNNTSADEGSGESEAQLLAEYQKTVKALDDAAAESDSSDSEDSSAEEMEQDDALDEIPLESILSYLQEVRANPKMEDPSAIITLFEQAVKRSPDDPTLWTMFTDYVEKELKDYHLAITAYSRAIENCPGHIPLVQSALLAHEKAQTPVKDIIALFDANEAHIETQQDGVSLYTTYIYLRRRLGASNVDLEALFKQGANNLQEYFGKQWDYDGVYRRNFSYFCYSKLGKPHDGLAISKDLLKSGHGNKAAAWLEAIRHERHFGVVENARKLLYEAVNSTADDPYAVFSYFIQFEREEGSREQVDKALQKVNAKVRLLDEAAAKGGPKKGAPKREARAPPSPNKRKPRGASPAEPPEPPLKRKRSEEEKTGSATVDKDGFLVPNMPLRARSASNSPKPSPSSSPRLEKPPKVKEPTSSSQSAEPEDSTEKPEASAKPQPEVSPECTIFLSNIPFSWKEANIQEKFPAAIAIRLPMRNKTQSKGYAYVDFARPEDAQQALRQDGELKAQGRPVHVSPYQPHAKGEKAPFKFGTQREENKLFVRNVHFDVKEAQLTELFAEFGTLQSVRIVTHPNGKPKGIAYVEFQRAEDARKALAADGRKLLGRKISVAISEPPAKGGPPRPTGPPPPAAPSKAAILAFKPRQRLLLDK